MKTVVIKKSEFISKSRATARPRNGQMETATPQTQTRNEAGTNKTT